MLNRADDNEQPHEEEDGNPLNFGEGVMHIFALFFRRLPTVGEQHQQRRTGKRHRAGFNVQRVAEEKAQKDEGENAGAFLQQADVGNRLFFIETHDAGAGAQGGFQLAPLRQPQHETNGKEDDDGNRRQVIDKCLKT